MDPKDSPNQIQEGFWILPLPLTVTCVVIQSRSGKWDVYTWMSPFLSGNCLKGSTFICGLLDPGW